MKSALKSIMVVLALASPHAYANGPHLGKNGGVGDTSGTYSNGEPTGGTYSINGTTGKGTFSTIDTTSSNTWSHPQITTSNGAITTDGGVTTNNTTVQVYHQASSSSSGTANEFSGFYSLYVPSGHGSGIAYEAAPVYARCVTGDSNTYALSAYDCVGGEFQAITTGTGQLMRIWGVDTTVRVSAGSDAYASGYENDIYNAGTAGGLQTPTAKQNLNMDCLGPNNCTSILAANVGGGALYNYGFPMISQIFVAHAPVFTVQDITSNFANMAGIFADGHTLSRNNTFVIGSAGSTRYVGYYTGANDSALSLRWNTGANGNAESGSDAGSDYNICRYSDSGSFIDCPISIPRATGIVNTTNISVSGTMTAGTVTATTYTTGATSGVSCAAGTVNLSTLVITNGLVTHC